MRLSLPEFAVLANKPMETARSWAHRYAADLDARRVAGRTSVDEKKAKEFLSGKPLPSWTADKKSARKEVQPAPLKVEIDLPPKAIKAPMGKRKGLTLRLSPEAWEQLRLFAFKQRKTAHDILIESLERYMKDAGAALPATPPVNRTRHPDATIAA